MAFYTYNQNNSGGGFDVDEAVAHYVIVEAENETMADEIAERVGIYFDGIERGIDCPCCGARWYGAWSGDSNDEPLIYGKKPEEHQDTWARAGEPYCHVYYMDGRKETHCKNPTTD